MSEHARVEILDSSHVGGARRYVSDVARRAGMSQTDVGRVALIATELGTNLVKHAREGWLLVRDVDELPGGGVELLSIDRGPGIANVAAAMRDGFSTAGSNGIGLGAVARAADQFDLHSQPEVGTVVLARVLAQPESAAAVSAFGAVCLACPGEHVSGDSWSVREERGRRVVLVVDGLGHGPAAAAAANESVRLFREGGVDASPAEVVQRLHAGLRATRGAALAVAELDPGRRLLRYAGIGNIAGTILAGGATRSLVSHHGTAGHDARRIQEFSYPLPRGATLVMHSDGLTGRWTTERYPGLLGHHPATLAAVLLRDFARGRDDATVVVLREAA